jgi:hypothetical protein
MFRFLQPSEKSVGNRLNSQCLDWLKKHLSHGQNQHVLAFWQRQQWRSSSGSLGSRGQTLWWAALATASAAAACACSATHLPAAAAAAEAVAAAVAAAATAAAAAAASAA